MKPSDMRPVGDRELLMTWDDGHRSLYSYEFLRLHCPCAGCVDEMSGKQLIAPELIPKDIHPIETAPVGHYAIRFRWSDGHQTGIYSFGLLREMCPCQSCQSSRA